jgi:hypothetical protein
VRPWFAGREAFVAAGFGLVHGLAFAGGLTEFHLDPWRMAAAILAFNLGIEAMQLVVVAVTVPSLVALSRTRIYPAVRIGGAAVGGVAALAWMAERALGWSNPIVAVVERAAAHAGWLAAGLAGLAVVAAGWRHSAGKGMSPI